MSTSDFSMCICTYMCSLAHIPVPKHLLNIRTHVQKGHLVNIFKSLLLQITIMHISECFRSKKLSFVFTLTHYKKIAILLSCDGSMVSLKKHSEVTTEQIVLVVFCLQGIYSTITFQQKQKMSCTGMFSSSLLIIENKNTCKIK